MSDELTVQHVNSSWICNYNFRTFSFIFYVFFSVRHLKKSNISQAWMFISANCSLPRMWVLTVTLFQKNLGFEFSFPMMNIMSLLQLVSLEPCSMCHVLAWQSSRVHRVNALGSPLMSPSLCGMFLARQLEPLFHYANAPSLWMPVQCAARSFIYASACAMSTACGLLFLQSSHDSVRKSGLIRAGKRILTEPARKLFHSSSRVVQLSTGN